MVYYAETVCQAKVKSSGLACKNLAYYQQDKQFLCGVHSKKDKRTELAKNPNAKKEKEEKLKQHFLSHEILKNPFDFGSITVKKMQMMKTPSLVNGVLNVFPNFKDGNRKDGFGCSSLSPKSLGPVNHGMPNLPPAKNIENYHQFAKFWEFEMYGNEIKPEYFQKRIDAYNDDKPYRHKHSRDILKKYGNVNIPKFSIFYDKNEKPHFYNYLQCRYFYCHFYELLAKKQADFITLKEKYKNGYHLCIYGYDGYEPEGDFMKMYLDTSKPFGHEMVLYTILMEDDPDKYPWNRYYQENKAIYEGVI